MYQQSPKGKKTASGEENLLNASLASSCYSVGQDFSTQENNNYNLNDNQDITSEALQRNASWRAKKAQNKPASSFIDKTKYGVADPDEASIEVRTLTHDQTPDAW